MILNKTNKMSRGGIVCGLLARMEIIMKTDRRTQKTKSAIYQALSLLMQEKRYANITIQEIIDHANIGRSTFYAHFATKDELLNSMVIDIFEFMNQDIMDHLSDGGQSNKMMIPVEKILEHAQENAKQIKGILKSESGELLFTRFKLYWEEKLEVHFTEHITDTKDLKVPLEFLINHITSSFIEMLKWWITKGTNYTPKQMEEYYEAVMLPSIMVIMKGE